MRFWPGWTWLREAIQDGRFGKVYAANFRRLVNHPGGPFYSDGARCGGAALDLHIHDTDFVQFCFGMPKAVTSFGYSKITNEPDHLITHYQYDDVPMVIAEGSWAMADGYVFNMGFTVNFENATAVYDSVASRTAHAVRDRARRRPRSRWKRSWDTTWRSTTCSSASSRASGPTVVTVRGCPEHDSHYRGRGGKRAERQDRAALARSRRMGMGQGAMRAWGVALIRPAGTFSRGEKGVRGRVLVCLCL